MWKQQGGRRWVLRTLGYYSEQPSHLCQRPKEGNGGRLNLAFFLVQTSVVGSAEIRGSCRQLKGWGEVVCEWSWQRGKCVSRCPHLSPRSLFLPLEWDGLGRWAAERITLKVCSVLTGAGPGLMHRVTPVSTYSPGVGLDVQKLQSHHPSPCAVPTSPGANRIPAWLWWLPTLLPWHS